MYLFSIIYLFCIQFCLPIVIKIDKPKVTFRNKNVKVKLLIIINIFIYIIVYLCIKLK